MVARVWRRFASLLTRHPATDDKLFVEAIKSACKSVIAAEPEITKVRLLTTALRRPSFDAAMLAIARRSG